MRRKGYLLATASGVAAAAAAGGAQAADMGLPAKALPLPPPPAASWAGWYVGLHAGVNWQNASNSTTYEDAPLGITTHTTGFIGGGQIGYNWQDGNFVFGLEADISGLSGTGSTVTRLLNDDTKSGFSNRIRWLNTDRIRMGLAVGNTMAYVTAGLAVGGVKNSLNLPSVGSDCAGGICNKSESKTRVGWAAGGGVEHILWNSNWTVGLEALFVDLGESSLGSPPNRTGGKTTKFSNQAVIGRLRLNYKF
jgi:outer membrane immunogenic protein